MLATEQAEKALQVQAVSSLSGSCLRQARMSIVGLAKLLPDRNSTQSSHLSIAK